MGDIQHRPLPLATIHENQLPSPPNNQKSFFVLNPACQSFAPKLNFMDLLDTFYELPLRAAALFSTCNGKSQKRRLPSPRPMRIVRSDFAKDVETKFNALWNQYRLQLYDLKPLTKPEDLYHFFDAVDLYIEGADFCYRVVARLSEHSQEQMRQTHVQIDEFARQWAQDQGPSLGYFHQDYDITFHHVDFSAENLSYFEHEEDITLLRNAVNHYLAEFHGRRRVAEETLMRVQNQLPNRGFQNMHIQAQYLRSAVRIDAQPPSYHGYQDARQDVLGQLHQQCREIQPFAHSEQTLPSGLRARDLSIESDRRGGRGGRHFNNQRGNRNSPPREQAGYQRKFSDTSSVRGPPSQELRFGAQSSQSSQPLHHNDDEALFKPRDCGPQVVITHGHNGNPTFTYDGESKENDVVKQIPLTIFVKNFDVLPEYYENHELKRMFSQCGQVVSVSYIAHNPVPFALVQFKEPFSVQEAIRKFDGYAVAPGLQLIVKPKHRGGKPRSGSGTSVSSNAYPIYRRDSIKERQPNSIFTTSILSGNSQLRPGFNHKETVAAEQQHMPLGRIENLPPASATSQGAQVNLSSEKENSPIKGELVLHNKNGKKKVSTHSTTKGKTLRSRSEVRSKKAHENPPPQSENFTQHQQKGLRIGAGDQGNENESIAKGDPMYSEPAGRQPKPMKKKKKHQKQKNKQSKSEGGYPDSYNASFCTDASSDAFSPIDPFSPTKNKTSTANTSFSAHSSKMPSLALSHELQALGISNARNFSIVSSGQMDLTAPSSFKPEHEQDVVRADNGTDGEVVTGMKKQYTQGHSKNCSNSSATTSSSTRKADAQKRGGKHGSVSKIVKSDAEKSGCGSEALELAARDAHVQEAESTDISTKQTVTPVPNSRAKELESLVLEEINSPALELAESASPTIEDEKVVPTTSDSPPAPSFEKTKIRPMVAVPLNFLGRPQPHVTNDLALNDNLDRLGSEAWPFIKSCRPL